jgi:two-component system, cell cycle sensor histidine kinase and response regulator CckA
MAQLLQLDESPAAANSMSLEAAEQRIRELEGQLQRLQLEIAALRSRHVRAGERDSGLGSLPIEREATFDEVERLANVGSWIWDVRTNEVAWSEQCFRIFGYDPEVDEARMENFYAALHPDDRDLLLSHSGRSATTGITAPAPCCRFIHKDGSTRHVILSGTPIRDQDNQLIRIVGAALDVTGFMTVNAELNHTAQLLNEAERLAGLGSWVLNESTQHIEWSETLYRIMGIAQGTRITKDLFYERVHPDDREHVRESHRYFAEGNSHPIEFRVLRPDGSQRQVWMVARHERDQSGQISRVLGMIQDVTDRTQLEQQLRHSQKMDAIGTFAGGIAHDFNNYLMVIQGNVQLIKGRTRLDQADDGILTEIGTAAAGCAALTRQLLSLARRQVSAPRVLDVSKLVCGSAALIRRLLGDHIELVLATSSHTVVRIDPAQLEQVVVNLAVNARDAMPEGGVVTIETARVTIDGELASSRPSLAPGEYVRLSVKDVGAGIPPAIQTRVFEPFFTTKSHGKGTGLGLSTVYAIVQQWHGHIELESQIGRGTVFHVWLPAQEGVPAERAPESERTQTARGTETVLLAEDEPQVRQLIRTLLEQAGYVVLVAENGEQALRKARRASQVDLLLSDVRMPHVGGVQLARQLRETWPEVKVLLMSGYPDIDAVTAHEGGAPLFAKPFCARELLERVRATLDQAAEGC